MDVHPIRNDEDLDKAYERIDALWGSPRGTPQGDELDVWFALVIHYEDEHYRIPPGDPVEVIKYKMGELGMNHKQVAEGIGCNARVVADILNGNKEITLKEALKVAEILKMDARAFTG